MRWAGFVLFGGRKTNNVYTSIPLTHKFGRETLLGEFEKHPTSAAFSTHRPEVPENFRNLYFPKRSHKCYEL